MRRSDNLVANASREVGEDTTETNDAEADSEPSTLEVFEAQFAKLPPVRCSGKIGSVTFLKKSGDVPSVSETNFNALFYDSNWVLFLVAGQFGKLACYLHG